MRSQMSAGSRTRGTGAVARERHVKRVLFACAAVSFFAVLLIFLFIARESSLSIKSMGFQNIFLSSTWNPNVTDPAAGSYGLLGFLSATLITTLGGLFIGGPLAVGTAVFIDQVAPRRTGALISRGIELLAGVPSVVIGWFGLTLLVPFIARATGTSGFGMFAAMLVLAVMVIPTVTTLSVEALRALPRELMEGSLAMGATRWQTIRRTLLPAARRGILVAVILGMGRAIGETMAVQMVLGNARQFTWSLLQPTSTLTSSIVTNMGESSGIFRSALYAQGLLLLLLSMLLIIAVRFLGRTRKVK